MAAKVEVQLGLAAEGNPSGGRHRLHSPSNRTQNVEQWENQLSHYHRKPPKNQAQSGTFSPSEKRKLDQLHHPHQTSAPSSGDMFHRGRRLFRSRRKQTLACTGFVIRNYSRTEDHRSQLEVFKWKNYSQKNKIRGEF